MLILYISVAVNQTDRIVWNKHMAKTSRSRVKGKKHDFWKKTQISENWKTFVGRKKMIAQKREQVSAWKFDQMFVY